LISFWRIRFVEFIALISPGGRENNTDKYIYIDENKKEAKKEEKKKPEESGLRRIRQQLS